jgi:hypothetical protein
LAPSQKIKAAYFAFFIGSSVSWMFLKDSWYPESFEGLAYQKTLLPFIITEIGGIVSLLYCHLENQGNLGQNTAVR